jgi:hypothetical protein
MSIRSLRAGRQNYNASTYLGVKGELFYVEETGEFKLSDAVTPGGKSIPITLATNATAGSVKPNSSFSLDPADGTLSLLPATDTIIGGLRLGPGVTLNSEDQLIIDSEGLEFSFGNFSAIVGTYSDSTDYALLSSINENEDIVIASNGNGTVNVVGEFEVYATNTTVGDALEDQESIFRVAADGQIRMLVPEADEIAGAFEIIGNALGEFHPPNQTGVILHTTSNTNIVNRIYHDASNNYPIIVGRRYNGVVGALTAVQEGETIFRIAGQASTGTDFETFGPAKINWIATENQGPNNQGGKITFDVTANGTNAFDNVVTALEITPEGITTPVGFVGDGGQLTNLPSPTVLSAVASTTTVTANNKVATTITNMTLTPPAGTYLATFSSQYTAPLLASVTSVAAADLAILYTELTDLTPTVTDHSPAYGSGETLGPGVYTQAGASSIAGTLTLNGGPNDLFVFRCAGALTTGNGATIVLTGGAVSSNVWWVAQGTITTGNNPVLRGSFFANQDAITLGSGASIEGRLLTVNGAIGINSADLTAPTGTSVLDQGSLTQFSIFAAIGVLTNTNASTIELSIGTNDGTITGFETATVDGEIYPAGEPDLAVISYGIYVDGVLIADSKRGQTQTRLQSGWTMTTQTIATVTAGQTVDVRTIVPLGGFAIGPAMSLILMPVTT